MWGARSNKGAALTRKANKALKGRVESATVKCSGYGASGEVYANEIEPLMSARQILVEAGIPCSPIQTFKMLEPCFYIGEGVEV
ncbi:hypothetical protein B9Z51_08815 [Limnohabitans sp. T6-5]|nr:hypothetical protein B9Z51_08815 [Limnohabitans sp. T6-5]